MKLSLSQKLPTKLSTKLSAKLFSNCPVFQMISTTLSTKFKPKSSQKLTPTLFTQLSAKISAKWSREGIKKCLDLIPLPLLSVKIQVMGGKLCLRCKGKTLLGVVNKLLKTKSLLTTASNVLPLHLKQSFPPII